MAASSSYTVSLNTNTSNLLHPQFLQKSSFQGVSVQEGKRGVFNPLVLEGIGSVKRRGFEVNARAGTAKNIEVEVDKPLGLTLGQKQGGGVVITAVENGGNAARAGLKAGDQVLYTSSFFGDELWPADKLGFTKTAIQAKPDSVYFVVNRLVLLTFASIAPDEYACPQCRAPKKRFARYDVETGKAIGGGANLPIGVIIGLLVGVGGVGALLVYGLQ
ncbi:hypothetical protein SASPL_103322 [Salvia splendens]|uniref:PDZ domain-containing protein n=1 Tax=Salvia splendens TaxID=180675 RepID=A0A8X8YTK5_SALSN|nr:hypothetical protein SASPL_103322 [Salvia splendens]